MGGNKPGLGLGRTLTSRIIRLHKGDITIESKPETDTVITVARRLLFKAYG